MNDHLSKPVFQNSEMQQIFDRCKRWFKFETRAHNLSSSYRTKINPTISKRTLFQTFTSINGFTMSRYESPREGRRPARKAVDSNPRRGRITQREMESSSHRLSRAPDRYNANRAVQAEKHEPYCVAFFKSNPDAVDLRPPTEKLTELEDQVEAGDQDASARFTTLMQIKSLQYMLHGEDSPESLRAHVALGKFYNENHRPESALRHFEKAKQLSQTNEIEENEEIEIAVEMAQAHVAIKSEKKAQNTKHANAAASIIEPYEDVDIYDAMLKYKRDAVKARIAHAKGQNREAIELYETALQSLDEAHDGEEVSDMAKLRIEKAECYEAVKRPKLARKEYQKAYDVYWNLGMEESARNLEGKLPTGETSDEEEERIESEHEEEEHEVVEPPPRERGNEGSEVKKSSSSSSEEKEESEKKLSAASSDNEKQKILSESSSQSEKHSSASHRSEKHESEKHSSASHRSEKNESEKHSSASHRSEKNESEKHSSASHRSEKNESEKHSSASHRSEKNESGKNSSASHRSERSVKDRNVSDAERKSEFEKKEQSWQVEERGLSASDHKSEKGQMLSSGSFDEDLDKTPRKNDGENMLSASSSSSVKKSEKHDSEASRKSEKHDSEHHSSSAKKEASWQVEERSLSGSEHKSSRHESEASRKSEKHDSEASKKSSRHDSEASRKSEKHDSEASRKSEKHDSEASKKSSKHDSERQSDSPRKEASWQAEERGLSGSEHKSEKHDNEASKKSEKHESEASRKSEKHESEASKKSSKHDSERQSDSPQKEASWQAEDRGLSGSEHKSQKDDKLSSASFHDDDANPQSDKKDDDKHLSSSSQKSPTKEQPSDQGSEKLSMPLFPVREPEPSETRRRPHKQQSETDPGDDKQSDTPALTNILHDVTKEIAGAADPGDKI